MFSSCHVCFGFFGAPFMAPHRGSQVVGLREAETALRRLRCAESTTDGFWGKNREFVEVLQWKSHFSAVFP